MSHPLLTGQTAATMFQAQITLPPYPSGQCATSLEDIRRWFEKLQASITGPKVMFGYTAGTMEAATPEDRDRPRFMFDDQGRALGLALWMPDLQGWTIPGQVGQLMTLRRLATTVSDDLAARPLAGWRLCDGTTPALPNLTLKSNVSVAFTTPNTGVATVDVPSQWFTGTGPDWETYTVGYVGA